MVAQALVEAGEQRHLGSDGHGHGLTRHLVGETVVEDIELLVGLLECLGHGLAVAVGVGYDLPHLDRHVRHSLDDSPAHGAHFDAYVGRRPLGDVLSQVGAPLELGQDQEHPDEMAPVGRGRGLLETLPDEPLHLGGQQIDPLVAVDNGPGRSDIPAQESVGTSGDGLGHESKQLVDPAVHQISFLDRLEHQSRTLPASLPLGLMERDSVAGRSPGGREGRTGRRATVRDALTALSPRDPVLAALIERHGPPHLPRTPAPARFATLARAIIFQQLAGRAASTIHGRFVERLGGEVTPEAVLQLDVETLMTCGLSRAKARSVYDLSEKVASGEVRLDRIGRLPDDAVIDHLIQVRGIGRWTAEMFLMFTLGRLDVWPIDDYGVRVGYATGWGLAEVPSRLELDGLGEPFRPYRSIAAWYCWRAAEDRPRPTRRTPAGPKPRPRR